MRQCRLDDPRGTILDVQKLTRNTTRTPNFDERGPIASSLDTLVNQGRNHMRGLQIKVISGTIKVRWKQKNCIEAVLVAVCLGLDQHHFFGQPVRRIRLFRIAVPKVVFFEGHRRELGVRTNGADRHKFPDAVQSRLLD